MNDCIERKKAIERIQPHVKPQTVYGEGYLQAIEHATDILELMPTADVQPVKRGTWENTNTPNQLRCSNCEIIHFIAQYPHGEINYCPNCGAEIPEGRQVCPVCENRGDK